MAKLRKGFLANKLFVLKNKNYQKERIHLYTFMFSELAKYVDILNHDDLTLFVSIFAKVSSVV